VFLDPRIYPFLTYERRIGVEEEFTNTTNRLKNKWCFKNGGYGLYKVHMVCQLGFRSEKYLKDTEQHPRYPSGF
jgi:hypothetical protein